MPQAQTMIPPEPPSIPDPSAQNHVTLTERLGLDWMRRDTNSPGPGNGHGIGPDDGNGVGENGIGYYGNGEGNRGHGPGFIEPMCSYCPYPTYADDARKAKVQGSVTLQVLVGIDGRAQDIRIVQGIGFGLDERAIETVRGWKFIPARDGAKHPLPAWVTVEASFRLF
jgi:protein TonB